MAARSRNISSRATFPALEWLEDAAGTRARLTMSGNRRAMVENHTGIVEFTAARIRLMTRQGVMTFLGRELMLTQIRPDALTVRGFISSVEFPDGGEENADA